MIFLAYSRGTNALPDKVMKLAGRTGQRATWSAAGRRAKDVVDAEGLGRRPAGRGLVVDWQPAAYCRSVGRRAMNQETRLDRVRIGSIVVRCHEYDRMFAFWQEALHYEVEHTDPNGGFVILRDPGGSGPNISLDQAPTKRTGKRGWLHLDLYTTNQKGEVERLLELGATRYPWRYGPGADYVVLEDPDGNLFCVVQLPPGEPGHSAP